MTPEKKLLQALIEEPSRYTILVLDNSMLPEKMKDNETVDFVIKPPTLETHTRCALPLQDLPVELIKPENCTYQMILPHLKTLVRIICIISWGKSEPYPDWYEEFFMKNCTPKEILNLFQETVIKMQTDFFLTSFQIASLRNPMMMRKIKKKKKNQSGSTPTS